MSDFCFEEEAALAGGAGRPECLRNCGGPGTGRLLAKQTGA